MKSYRAVCLAILAAIFILFCGPASAESRGTCGENVNWTLDDEGLLTIRGSGRMTDVVDIYTSIWPWESAVTAVIEDGVTSIAQGAFSGCAALQSISIPSSVRSVGDAAFSGCSSLKSVVLPEGVKSIGNIVFDGCSSLEHVSLPESLVYLCDFCFRGCASISELTIPAGVTVIYDTDFPPRAERIVFLQDKNTHVNISGGRLCISPDTTVYCFRGSTIESCARSSGLNVRLLDYLDGGSVLTLPADTLHIGDESFSGCACETVVIPDGCVSIGKRAFANCESLAYVVIPASVTSIDDSAFDGCDNVLIERDSH